MTLLSADTVMSQVLYFRYSACDEIIPYLYGKYIEKQYFDLPTYHSTKQHMEYRNYYCICYKGWKDYLDHR